jgi:calcium-dependent protein kinase
MGCGFGSKNTKKSIKSSESKISLENFIRLSSEDPDIKYKRESKLGQGSFSYVFQAVNRTTNQKVALKFISKELISASMKDKDFKLKEAAILRSLDHPNIIKCFEVYEVANYLVISEELIQNGTLLDHIKGMTSKLQPLQIALLTSQILSALAYCHERQIVHRDIKLENIFVTKDLQVKVADFGCSELLNRDHTVKGLFGTIMYMAPEIFAGSYNEKVDLWSLGIILFMLVVGRPPFSMKNKEQLIKNIGTIPFLLKLCPEIQAFSPGFENFMQGLLEIDQAKRLSAMNALSHPWLKQFLKPDLDVHSKFSMALKKMQRKTIIQKTMSMYINYFCDLSESFETYNYFKAIDQDG